MIVWSVGVGVLEPGLGEVTNGPGIQYMDLKGPSPLAPQGCLDTLVHVAGGFHAADNAGRGTEQA